MYINMYVNFICARLKSKGLVRQFLFGFGVVGGPECSRRLNAGPGLDVDVCLGFLATGGAAAFALPLKKMAFS